MGCTANDLPHLKMTTLLLLLLSNLKTCFVVEVFLKKSKKQLCEQSCLLDFFFFFKRRLNSHESKQTAVSQCFEEIVSLHVNHRLHRIHKTVFRLPPYALLRSLCVCVF